MNDILTVLQRAKPLLESRVTTLSEVPKWIDYLSADNLNYAVSELFNQKGQSLSVDVVLLSLETAKQIVLVLPEGFKAIYVEKLFRHASFELQLKPSHLFWPVRIAISGKRVALPLFESMEILGRERCLDRIEAALFLVKQN